MRSWRHLWRHLWREWRSERKITKLRFCQIQSSREIELITYNAAYCGADSLPLVAVDIRLIHPVAAAVYIINDY